MPLKKCYKSKTKKSKQKCVSKNISELVRSYDKTGKIGNSKPKSRKKAIKQAVAIGIKSGKKPKSTK